MMCWPKCLPEKSITKLYVTAQNFKTILHQKLDATEPGWEQITNYGRRSQVEGTFSRWKRMLGGTIKAKNDKNQIGEMKIGVFILNETLKKNPRKARIVA